MNITYCIGCIAGDAFSNAQPIYFRSADDESGNVTREMIHSGQLIAYYENTERIGNYENSIGEPFGIIAITIYQGSALCFGHARAMLWHHRNINPPPPPAKPAEAWLPW